MERRWKVLIVAAVAVFMGFLDVTIVNVAFTDAYGVMAAAALAAAGLGLGLGRVRGVAPEPVPEAA